jgi:Flavodoxin
MPARKRTLIVYYSLSGNTQRVAKDLAAYLGADLLRIRERTDRHGFRGYLRAAFDSLRERPTVLMNVARDAGDYELTIVGTPIWAGRITPAVRTYLESIRGRARNIAFFTTSGNTDVEKVVPVMQRLVDLESIASIGFSASELRDAACYENKLTAFLSAVRRLAAARTVRDLRHAYA